MKLILRQAGVQELDTLMEWRMEVLREVFNIPPEHDMMELEKANRSYYRNMLETEGHIACFACLDCAEEIIGCGGICIYQEMPSPGNPAGRCAYLMNIYTRPRFRGQGVGEKIVSENWLSTDDGLFSAGDTGRDIGCRRLKEINLRSDWGRLDVTWSILW